MIVLLTTATNTGLGAGGTVAMWFFAQVARGAIKGKRQQRALRKSAAEQAAVDAALRQEAYRRIQTIKDIRTQ
jgi:hypothetical protein